MTVGWASDLLGRLLAQRIDHGRFVRGRELLEDGRVVALEIQRGKATAYIIGSRLSPYDVKVMFPVDGRPTDADDLRFSCSCPDWGDPCKHGVAVAFAVAEALDDDPGLAIALWGEERGATPPRPPRPPSSTVPVGPLPTDRPAWADTVGPAAPSHTIEQWLGHLVPASAPLPVVPSEPVAALDALGPMVVGDGWDLAPALRRLVLDLLDG
jgi:hypothetical protein